MGSGGRETLEDQIDLGKVSKDKIAEFFKGSNSKKKESLEYMMSPPTSTAILP